MGLFWAFSCLGLKSFAFKTVRISSLSNVVKVYSLTSFLLLEGVQAFRGRPPGPAGGDIFVSSCIEQSTLEKLILRNPTGTLPRLLN